LNVLQRIERTFPQLLKKKNCLLILKCCIATDERGQVISVRKKIIHFIWTGPDCGIMEKAKGATASGEFREAFPGCAVFLQVKDPEELNETLMESKLRACGGAHQPKYYDFENKPVEGI